MSEEKQKANEVPHHFDSRRQQVESNKLGIWLFLCSEIMMFGGLFCGYVVYRASHPEIFIYAHQFLDKTLGGINTLVLICSSLTMALAVRSAQTGNKKALVTHLIITMLCACGFMGIKAVEYNHKWKHGLLWGQKYNPEVHEETHEEIESTAADKTEVATPAKNHKTEIQAMSPYNELIMYRSGLPPPAKAPQGLAGEKEHATTRHVETPPNVHIFFGIYFLMTGLHGLHVLIGIGLIFWLTIRASKDEFGPDYFSPVDSVGLYWHLVDLIWIYLFPLLYLIH